MTIRNASTTALSAALLMSIVACGTINRGVRRVKGLKDPSTPAQAFQLQPNTLPGLYVADENGHNSAYLFTANTVEIYTPADKANNCAEPRPYALVGNTIEIHASANCKAGDTLAVNFADSRSIEVNMGTPSANILRPVSQEGLANESLDWDTAGATISPGLKSFFVLEPAAATVDAQRSDLRAALEGGHIALQKSALSKSFADTDNGVVTRVTGYKKGAEFAVTDMTQVVKPSTADGPVCFLSSLELLPLADISPLESFNEKVTTVTLLSSRLAGGVWKMTNHDAAAATVAETDSLMHQNSIEIDLAPTINTPAHFGSNRAPTVMSALKLNCTKAAGPNVLTLADIQAAVGTNLVIGK